MFIEYEVFFKGEEVFFKFCNFGFFKVYEFFNFCRSIYFREDFFEFVEDVLVKEFYGGKVRFFIVYFWGIYIDFLEFFGIFKGIDVVFFVVREIEFVYNCEEKFFGVFFIVFYFEVEFFVFKVVFKYFKFFFV